MATKPISVTNIQRGGGDLNPYSGSRDEGGPQSGSSYKRKPPGYAQKPPDKKPWRPGSKPWAPPVPIIPWNPYTPGHPDQEGQAPGWGQWGHSDPGDEDPTYSLKWYQKPLHIDTGPYALPKDEFGGGGPSGYHKGGALGMPPSGLGSPFGIFEPERPKSIQQKKDFSPFFKPQGVPMLPLEMNPGEVGPGGSGGYWGEDGEYGNVVGSKVTGDLDLPNLPPDFGSGGTGAYVEPGEPGGGYAGGPSFDEMGGAENYGLGYGPSPSLYSGRGRSLFDEEDKW